MIPYSQSEESILAVKDVKVYSFLKAGEANLDVKTVESFGDEWARFNDFKKSEIENIGNDYFDIVPMLTSDMISLDVGCGSGRWAYYLQSRVKFIEAIDPSQAVYVAASRLQKFKNIRVTQASVENLPFQGNSFDFVYSLGVLHHVPDTASAIKQCYKKTKSGGWFLLYLYYNLENRGTIFRALFWLSNMVRYVISSCPSQVKHLLCDIIAVFVYWPLAKASYLFSLVSEKLAQQIPLSYYRKTSFFVMRNDSLDRFGTPLEKRFSKQQITSMLESVGFSKIQFSSREPFWHVIAQKP